MKMHELAPALGSTKEAKRIGRGHGSGNGKTAGKGHKGQKARAGHGMRPGFEGGQMPLQRRVPKRGFNNIFAQEWIAINVSALEVFEDGSVVDAAALAEKGIIKKANLPVKVLGNGKLTKKLEVKLNAYSASAAEKINAAENSEDCIRALVVSWFLLKKVVYVQFMVNKDILEKVHEGNIKKQRNQAKTNADEIPFVSYSDCWRSLNK